MKTSEPLQQTFWSETELPLTQSVAGSPVKTLAMLESALALKVKGLVCGENTGDLLANYDPASSSWRTSQGCWLMESAQLRGTWPRSGMTRNGKLYQLRPLALPTFGNVSGLLPTPRKGCAIELEFSAKAMAKAVRKGSSVYGPCSVFAELGMDRPRILVAYTRLMGFPPGWTKLPPLATPSSRKSRN